ncbi:STAS domain-containing protein [Streptomyces sp. TLI_146]|uniref:STAS domain-containing protein n=1 Tax=Streptomyces sp. TLI_146 TaxID=1938858 RepID=UPI000C70CAAD|nr:STAS domain-containing protein [Streptomyces sp. TLI_146]PKV90088.1 anti-anti-sigma factor [Streptomyces sp. TLI_146]
MNVEEVAFFLRERTVGAALVIELHGELDIWARTQLSPRLEELLDRPWPSVAVDLSGVTFLDACGLGMLVWLQARIKAYGGRLSLVRPAPNVARILRITRLDRAFTLLDDLPASCRVPAPEQGASAAPASPAQVPVLGRPTGTASRHRPSA